MLKTKFIPYYRGTGALYNHLSISEKLHLLAMVENSPNTFIRFDGNEATVYNYVASQEDENCEQYNKICQYLSV